MWELIFMMVVLKLPIVYLCAVVLWAIRAEPKPLEGAPLAGPSEPDPANLPGCNWAKAHRPRSPRRDPRGGRSRTMRAVHARGSR